MCVFGGKGERKRGKVVLGDVGGGSVGLGGVEGGEDENGKEGSGGLNEYGGWVGGRVWMVEMYEKWKKKREYEG